MDSQLRRLGQQPLVLIADVALYALVEFGFLGADLQTSAAHQVAIAAATVLGHRCSAPFSLDVSCGCLGAGLANLESHLRSLGCGRRLWLLPLLLHGVTCVDLLMLPCEK